MKKWSFLILFTASTVGFAQENQMPAPGPEEKALAAFAGTWKFEGKAEDGPMGPGGPVSMTETCEMFEGGFALVCRAEGKNTMGPSKTLAIMSYDREKKAYTYYAVEKDFPPFMAIGKNTGNTWNWDTDATMGGQTMKTKVTVTLTTPTTQTFEMKMSTDGGKTWVPAMSAKSTKTTS
ncbi:MAG TPA: DUF1579 family protein [Vicinamibacteria bacterium]|nr:DUF1579 family protein [Vicinamibacteria bacterium]